MEDVISKEPSRVMYTGDINLPGTTYRKSNIACINSLQDRDFSTEEKGSINFSTFQINTNSEFFISEF